MLHPSQAINPIQSQRFINWVFLDHGLQINSSCWIANQTKTNKKRRAEKQQQSTHAKITCSFLKKSNSFPSTTISREQVLQAPQSKLSVKIGGTKTVSNRIKQLKENMCSLFIFGGETSSILDRERKKTFPLDIITLVGMCLKKC